MEAMTPAEYDAGWESWDDMKMYGPFSRHLRRVIHTVIDKIEFASVLDVGCGQGALLTEICARSRARPFGTDISAVGLRLAKQRLPQGVFSILDITTESLDETFDLVICSEVLEHISDDVAALRMLRKMTGKYLLVTTPQGRMRTFETSKDIGHVRNYAPGELARKMEIAGFRVVQTIEWGFPWYSPLYRNYLELTGGRGTKGKYGVTRKVLANAVYLLFMLNSWTRGDELVILAQPV
jgi:SAM-dependent methyltransferase